MIIHYGMGKQNIYPDLSDHSKYLIDQEINKLLVESHENALTILNNCKDLIIDCAEILKKTNILKPEDIIKIVNKKYTDLWKLYDTKNNYK
jgi:ATP-dependent Zn protease